MKYALLSIIIAALGMVFLWNVNVLLAETFLNLQGDSNLEPTLVTTSRVYKMTLIIIGLIALFAGIKGLKKARKVSLIGIVLSLVLLILIFIPLWSFFI